MMKIRVPEYFKRFLCIADRCEDSCCIGWEIDIDRETMKKYEALGGEIAEKTRHATFPLDKNGRCAFLDGHGLCRIISEHGEEYLCSICREHPRYYGVGDGYIDGGIGLGCPEAARMILSLDSLPRLITTERDIPYYDQDPYSATSEAVRDALTESIFTLDARELIGKHLAYARFADDAAFEVATTGENVRVPRIDYTPCEDKDATRLLSAMLTLLGKCEALTAGWKNTVNDARDVDMKGIGERMGELRALTYYFTHRYVREGVEDMTLGARVAFAILSALSTVAIGCKTGDLVTAATLYSKNVEYSTDNVDFILGELDLDNI